MFKVFHPKAAEYTFFSMEHGTFSMIDHMLGHKRNLNKFKKIEITSSISSDLNTMKLEINYKNAEKHAKTWKLNKLLLNNEWVKNEVKEESNKYLETNENEDTTIQKSVGHWESSPKRKIHSITDLSQKKKSFKMETDTPHCFAPN